MTAYNERWTPQLPLKFGSGTAALPPKAFVSGRSGTKGQVANRLTLSQWGRSNWQGPGVGPPQAAQLAITSTSLDGPAVAVALSAHRPARQPRRSCARSGCASPALGAVGPGCRTGRLRTDGLPDLLAVAKLCRLGTLQSRMEKNDLVALVSEHWPANYLHPFREFPWNFGGLTCGPRGLPAADGRNGQ